MQLLGKNSRVRKQNAGNICLVIFLTFLCSIFLLPIAAQEAYANQNPSLRVIENQITVTDNQVSVYMLLEPVTDQHFDSIVLDFGQVLAGQGEVTATYQLISESIYGDIYGYVVNFIYNIPAGATLAYYDRPVLITDSDGNLVLTEYVNLEVKPPNQNVKGIFKVTSQQNTFPVGETVTVKVHLQLTETNYRFSAVAFDLYYDPAYLQPILVSPGSQIPADCTTISSIQTSENKVAFASVGKNDKGPLDLAEIQFKVLREGKSTLRFGEVSLLDNKWDEAGSATQDYSFTTVGGMGIQVDSVSGRVALQDRFDTNYSQALVTAVGGIGTTTDTGGNYSLDLEPGNYVITASYPRCLMVKRSITLEEGQILPNIDFTLTSGDANGDNRVNLQDLIIYTQSKKNQQGDWKADFNGDGVVNELDKAILDRNYGKVGDSL